MPRGPKKSPDRLEEKKKRKREAKLERADRKMMDIRELLSEARVKYNRAVEQMNAPLFSEMTEKIHKLEEDLRKAKEEYYKI